MCLGSRENQICENPRNKWTSSEEAVLKTGVSKYGKIDWRRLAAASFSKKKKRTWRQCKERHQILQEEDWTALADEKLREHARKCYPHFGTIGLLMNRSSISCSDRLNLIGMNWNPEPILLPAEPDAPDAPPEIAPPEIEIPEPQPAVIEVHPLAPFTHTSRERKGRSCGR